MRQLEGFIEHSSERTTQEEADKPPEAFSRKCNPPPTEDDFLESPF